MPSEYTPLIQQYWDIKHAHPDSIVFFRCGDFYEMFYEDAQIAAEELDLVLTARGKDNQGPIPLAGIPYHAYQGYAARLLKKGYRIALCEQVEDPKHAKGLVRRAVTRVLTPGTVVDELFVESSASNFLMVIVSDGSGWGVAACDVAAGDTFVFSVHGSNSRQRLMEELAKISPCEIIGPSFLAHDIDFIRQLQGVLGLPSSAMVFSDQYMTKDSRLIKGLFTDGVIPRRIMENSLLKSALCSLSSYIKDMHGAPLSHMSGIGYHEVEEHIGLDPSTIRNLELLRTMQGGDRQGSLIAVLDRTVTAMGGRLLRRRLVHPIKDIEHLETRLDSVECFVRSVSARENLRNELRGVHDIPRLLGRVVSKRVSYRDLLSLKSSLERLPRIQKLCDQASGFQSDQCFDAFPSLVELLQAALYDEETGAGGSGPLVRPGYSPEFDEVRELADSARDWVVEFQNSERERTGIKSLKVRHNRVFGFFIEVTKPNLSLVPDDYQRKQTTAGGERFITDELKTRERDILEAETKLAHLEEAILKDLAEHVSEWALRLKEVSARLAELDVDCSLAQVAEQHDYVRPKFTDSAGISLRDSRHPVLEQMSGCESFVPNDVRLGSENCQIVLLTGPNMSGKSTYLRQVALAVIMAQIGSFVAAREAQIGIVDAIFTRVGAGDDLSRGQSTFMVEMQETAHILTHATPRSLVVLDEVGRGTSTYDGLSLAWSIVEYLNQVPERRAMTLFATHYHELTELAELFPDVVNMSVDVNDSGDTILFLHRIVAGSTGRSYGIHVARMAGFPSRVLDKAQEILYELERDEQRDVERKRLRASSKAQSEREPVQLSLFSVPERSPVLEELRRCDPNNLTPLEALQLISKWRKLV